MSGPYGDSTRSVKAVGAQAIPGDPVSSGPVIARAFWPSPSGAARMARVAAPLLDTLVAGLPTLERMPGSAMSRPAESSAELSPALRGKNMVFLNEIVRHAFYIQNVFAERFRKETPIIAMP